MVSATRRKKRDEIKLTVGPFRNIADYSTCIDIQREVWRLDDIDVVPATMLIASDHYGGVTLGGYSSLGEMIGFVTSMLGCEGDRLLQHSHMLGVRQAYRNFDVGYRIKLAQRKETLRRRIGLIVWTFDPMQPLNAYFNLAKLGTTTNEYVENFYGESTSALHRGLPTDRFVTRWELENPDVEQRLESGPPHHDLRKELKRYPVVNELHDVAPGMAGSSPLRLDCDAPELLFEVPYNLPEIKSRNLGVALEWQGKMRQFFRTYFKKGYTAKDFCVVEDEGHLRAFYLLEKA